MVKSMNKVSNKRSNIIKKVDQERDYGLAEVISLIKDLSIANFDESVDFYFNLNTDSRNGDHSIRSSCTMPSGTGKKVTVAAFVSENKKNEALEAGADYVGSSELIESIKKGEIVPDKCIATPDMMSQLSKIARILGPKGIMPNPKLGTVTNDVATVVKDIKKGRLYFRADKNSIVHASIGKCSFSCEDLVSNFESLFKTLMSLKPQSLKGPLINKVSASSTMGLSFKVTLDDLVTIK